MAQETHYIYKITNTVNGKLYIGQTKDPKYRWSEHKSDAATRAKYPLHLAMNKYGWINFTFEVIDFGFTQSQTDCVEDGLMVKYQTRDRNKGYNIRPGGNVNPPTNKTYLTHQEEQQISIEYQSGSTFKQLQQKYHISTQRISRMLKTAGISVRKNTNAGKKMPHTEETKEKLRQYIHPKKLNPAQEQQIVNLYQSGLGSVTISKQLQLNSSLVCRTLKRCGISFRNQ